MEKKYFIVSTYHPNQIPRKTINDSNESIHTLIFQLLTKRETDPHTDQEFAKTTTRKFYAACSVSLVITVSIVTVVT